MTTLELASLHPEAYASLPAAYQGDSCLAFWQDSGGCLWCSPAAGQESVLGEWKSIYNPSAHTWSL